MREEKERRIMHLTIHFQSIFKNLSFLSVKKFFIKAKATKTTLLVSSCGSDDLYVSICHSKLVLKPEEHPACPLHLVLHEREVRLSASCESGPSDVPSSSSWIQGARCVNPKRWCWVPLTQPPAILSLQQSTQQWYLKGWYIPAIESIDAHPRI